MTTNTKIVIATLSCLVLALVLWKVVRESSPPLAERPTEVTDATIPNPAAANPAASHSQPLASRSEVALETRAAATTGSLLVQMLWEDGQQPADGIGMIVRSSDVAEPMFAEREATTDLRGVARITELPAGRAFVVLDRGPVHEARITAALETTLTLTLPAALRVEGVVVDSAGAPVAGADVLLWNSRALAVTHTRTDGSFDLRGAPSGGWLAARAAGYAPSVRQQLQGAPGGTVRMRLVLEARGGAVSGLVRDPTGKPLAGAIVEVGEATTSGATLPDGTRGLAPPASRVRTDRAGAFHCAGVAAGRQTLRARARGHAPFVGTVDVIVGRESTVTIDLELGVTVAGRVVDPQDRPVTSVLVSVGVVMAREDPLEATRTWTNADGAYELRGLAPGVIEIVVAGSAAGDQRGHAEARTKITARAGDHVRWDVRLGEALTIRGRVIDERGVAVSHADILGMGNGYMGMATTAEDGRFQLKNCKDVLTRIDVRTKGSSLPRARLEGVLPGADELVITLRDRDMPSISIVGTVVGGNREPIVNATVLPMLMTRGSPGPVKVDGQNGKFRAGPYPAGWWAVMVQAPGLAPSAFPFREVQPNETWDVGEVRLQQPGSLRVTAKRSDGSAIAAAKFRILAVGDATMHSDYVQVSEGAGRTAGLAPGEYRLHACCEACATSCATFKIESLAETTLDLVLSPGISHTVRFQVPDEQLGSTLLVTIRDARDRLIANDRLWATRACNWLLCFAPGKYRVEATTPHGLRGSGQLEVSDSARPSSTTVEVR